MSEGNNGEVHQLLRSYAEQGWVSGSRNTITEAQLNLLFCITGTSSLPDLYREAKRISAEDDSLGGLYRRMVDVEFLSALRHFQRDRGGHPRLSAGRVALARGVECVQTCNSHLVHFALGKILSARLIE